jgi:hypothetical protein
MPQATMNGWHKTNGHTMAMPPSQKPSGNDGTPTRASDRTEDGKFASGNLAGRQFTPGNKIASGNPTYRRMAQLRLKVLEVMTPERLKELIESLFNRAKAGDAACAKLLLQYALGKAPPPVDPDCQDLHEWGIVSSFPTSAAVMAAVVDSVLPGPAADAVRGKAMLTATVEQVLEKLRADCRTEPRFFQEEYRAEKAARRRRAPRV